MTPDRRRFPLLLPGILRGVGDILVAVAFLTIGLYLVGELRDARQDLDDSRDRVACISAITGEVSQAEGQLKVETFDGLVAVAQGDDAGLAEAVERGNRAKVRLSEALEARENAEETCSG